MRYKLVLDELESKCWSRDRVLFDHPHMDKIDCSYWFLPNNTDFWVVCVVFIFPSIVQEASGWSRGCSTWHHCAGQGSVRRNHSCEHHYSMITILQWHVHTTYYVCPCVHHITLYSYMCRCHVSWQMMTSCLPSSLGRYNNHNKLLL